MSATRRIRIVGGRVLDPASGIDQVIDLVLENGFILGPARGAGASDGELVIAANGLVVAPGFVDIHCHLREPGFEDKETIATGTRAAAAGGFTTVCAMPNTNPVVDCAPEIEWVVRTALRDAVVHVRPIGAITKGQAGTELAELAEMAAVGAVGFSDDGSYVASGRLMRHALLYAQATGKPIIDHAEDAEIVDGGVMNEGPVATTLGLRGSPGAAEHVAVSRDIALAEATNGRLHLAHVSTAAAAEHIRAAKARGARVTAEVTPHHLLMNDSWVTGSPSGRRVYDTACRVNPPLRSERDRLAMVDAILDGTITAIATDHAPHTVIDKECEFDFAAPGISGIETAFAQLMGLVAAGRLDLRRLIELLTCGPARAFDLDAGSLRVGEAADVVIIDPSREWTVDASKLMSKGKNTPLDGQRMRGRVVATIVDGQMAYDLDHVQGD